MGKTVRMADIAEKLGISVVSVSKALAGKSGVSEEMRGKVIALARQMGYETVRTADAPDRGNIGVLVADRFFEENAFYTELYRALVLASGKKGLTCMVEIVSPEMEGSGSLPALVTGRKVDGVILMGNLEQDYLRAVSDSGLPCLLLDFHVPGRRWDCVLSDNEDGAFSLTRHLLERGRTRIGFVGSILSTSSIMDRYLGYLRALRMENLTPSQAWLVEDRDGDGKFIPLELPEEMPDAFLCSCDEVAFHLVDLLRRAGLRVPEDVAVCGYDDYRFAALCRPPLTTYRVDVEQMAEIAAERLRQKINREKAEPFSCTIPGRIVIRESSG